MEFAIRETQIFSLDNQRRLVTNLGHPVMGIREQIKVQPATFRSMPEGRFKWTGNSDRQHQGGGVSGEPDAAEICRRVVYRGEADGFDVRPQVQSGHIEESNVNSLSEMVKMIQGMRSYESAQKLIQTLDHMTDTAIQDLGRVQ